MNEREAFLADAVENPDDDAPRLVFADWLDEQSGESDRALAEFIRLECAAAKLPQTHKKDERRQTLLAAHAADWFGPVADKSIVREYETDRGFVSLIELPPNQFSAHAAAIFAHCPLIEEVFLTHVGFWKRCFARPEWAKVRCFGAADFVMTAQAAVRLAESASMSNLRELNLAFSAVGPRGGAAIGRSPHLTRLEALDLLDSHVQDRGATAILTRKQFAGLTELGLAGNTLTDETAEALASATHLNRLTSLSLHDNGLTDSGIEQLAAAPHLAGLTSLNLHTNRFGDAGAEALLASPHLGQLRSLAVGRNAVSAAMVERLRQRFGKHVTA
jgi:uncharacterized protein (TIGR02996 family)